MTRNELIALLDGMLAAGWRIEAFRGWQGKPELQTWELRFIRDLQEARG